jgi:hypothetical protein
MYKYQTMKPQIRVLNIRLLLSFILTLLSSSSFNQVIYFDINPDTTIKVNDGFYNLDFIVDDSIDFQIRLRLNPPSNTINVKAPNDSCFIAGFDYETCYIAHRFNLNDTIADVVGSPDFWQWMNHQAFKMASTAANICGTGGQFLGKNDIYLGLKWNNSNIPYFCWVRCDVADDASWFTIKDYGYGPYLMIAGKQTSTYLNEYIINDDFQVFSCNDRILVNAKDGIFINQANFFNMLAQEFTVDWVNNEIIINRNQFNTGLYVLLIRTNKGINSIKILLN